MNSDSANPTDKDRSQMQITKTAVGNLLAYARGDLRDGFCHHYEQGCGRCTFLEAARDAFKAAVIGAGLLLGCDVTLPSKNRWLSCSAAMGSIVGGYFCRGLGCVQTLLPLHLLFASGMIG